LLAAAYGGYDVVWDCDAFNGARRGGFRFVVIFVVVAHCG